MRSKQRSQPGWIRAPKREVISDQILRKRGKPRGYALFTVLCLAGILMLLAGAIGSEVLASQSATKTRLGNSRARYAAYAGLQHAVRLLKDHPDHQGDLTEYLLPESQNVSYTVSITNNSVTNDPNLDAPDGTRVPPGFVYCTAIGVDNEKEGVSLHAYAGMLSDQHPELSYSAFSDVGTNLMGNSQCLSYSAGSAFGPDSDGRHAPTQLGDQGNVGTNQSIEMSPQATVSGNVLIPPGNVPAQTAITEDLQVSVATDPPDVLDLPEPVDIPKYSAPVAAPAVNTPVQGGPLNAPTTGETMAVSSVNVPPGQPLTMGPGKYFVSGDLNIEGLLQTSADVSDTNPVIIYVGGNANIGGQAQVNLDGASRNLQIYFVDQGQAEQKFQLSGNANFFGTVVGNRVDAEFSDNAQLFGGFLGHSVTASDNARLFYDETLTGQPLGAASAWGLNGITEPKPDVVLRFFEVARLHVERVMSGSIVYQPAAYTATAPSNPSQSQ